MAFQLTDGRRTMLTDFPYESGAFGYMRWPQASVTPSERALCLITHSHRDHWLPSLAAPYCAQIAGPRDVAAALPDRDLGKLAAIDWGGVEIVPIPTKHGPLEHFSYRVTWNGLRLYFTGDTDDLEPLLSERDLDVAFVSPWLLRAAQNRAARIPARRIVVYHHRDGEAVAEHQGREVPAQGQELVLSAR